MKWPVITRGALWMLIAMLAAFIAASGTITPERFDAMGWFDWAVFWSGVALAGFTSLRTFMDQTVARYNGVTGDSQSNDGKI
jgi:hypothetical protein